ncbi:hypothetical protein L9F63_009861, partial [Diploptera punctata]
QFDVHKASIVTELLNLWKGCRRRLYIRSRTEMPNNKSQVATCNENGQHIPTYKEHIQGTGSGNTRLLMVIGIDGAPPHYAIAVREILDGHLQNRFYAMHVFVKGYQLRKMLCRDPLKNYVCAAYLLSVNSLAIVNRFESADESPHPGFIFEVSPSLIPLPILTLGLKQDHLLQDVMGPSPGYPLSPATQPEPRWVP